MKRIIFIMASIVILGALPLPAVPLPDSPGVDGGARSQEAVQQAAQPVPAPAVELFVTSWCGYCRKMESFLIEKGIKFTKHDIEKDPSAAVEYRDLGARGVPVIRIGDNVIHGYNPAAVMRYLESGAP